MRITVKFEADLNKLIKREYQRRDGQGVGVLHEMVVELDEGVETIGCTQECFDNSQWIARLTRCLFVAEYNQQYNSFRIVNVMPVDKTIINPGEKEPAATAPASNETEAAAATEQDKPATGRKK